MLVRSSWKICVSLILMTGLIFCAGNTMADTIAQWYYWNNVGNVIGKGVASYRDYKAERQLWKNKVAAAREQMRRCGDCPEAKAELDKWQGIENQFQDVAGSLAASVNMPPAVARFLGIDLAMAPARTQEEIEKACKVVRRPWVNERPDFCQEAVDRHLACIKSVQIQENYLCVQEVAEDFGGQCWTTKKQYDNCYRQDYEAFQREESLKEKRRDGTIIPEFRYPEVCFGSVPNDFIPPLPPKELLLKELYAPYNDALLFNFRFFMNKKGKGFLDDIAISRFSRPLVDFNSPCGDISRPKNDPQLDRVCQDYWDMDLYDSNMITCRYSGEPDTYQPRYVYWYGERPAGAAIERLAQRVPNHPLLRVGEAREECPATLAEAEKIQQEYARTLGEIQASITPIPADQKIPRTKQELELLKKYEAKVKKQQEREETMESFPKTGVFDFELDIDLGDEKEAIRGECVMLTEESNEFLGLPICRDTEGNLYGGDSSYVWKGYLILDWMRTYYMFKVDQSDPGQEGHVLIGEEIRGSGQARLTRTGDVPDVTELLLEGRYEFNLQLNGKDLTAKCDLVRRDLFQNHVYVMRCTDDEGIHFETWAETARVSRVAGKDRFEDEDPLPYVRILFKHPTLGGESYYYTIPPWSSAANPADELIGRSYHGHVSHMVRLGDIDGLTWANDRSSERLNLTGTWVGAFNNLFGKLDIYYSTGGMLQARLEFQGKESGSYLLKGSVDHEKRTFDLVPTRWIKQPRGYEMIGFKGEVALSTVSTDSYVRGILKNPPGSFYFVREDTALPPMFVGQDTDAAARTSSEAAGLTGSWTGQTSRCGLNEPSVELILHDLGNGNLQGQVNMKYPRQFNSRVSSEMSYLVKGTANDQGKIELTPDKWIKKSEYAAKQGISGTIVKSRPGDNTAVLEEISGRAGGTCDIRLVRVDSLLHPLDSVPDEFTTGTGSKRSVSGQAPIKRQAKQQAKPQAKPEVPVQGRKCTLDEVAGAYRTGKGFLYCETKEDGLDCCYGNLCRNKAGLALDADGLNLEGTWSDASGRSGPLVFPLSSECGLESGKWNRAGKEDVLTWGAWKVMERFNIAGQGRSALPDKGKAKREGPATDRKCNPEDVAGGYWTSRGPLICTAGADKLNCCYDNTCRNNVELTFDASGRNLEGIWKYPTGVSGPVIFPVSEECELESGKWSNAGKEPRAPWRIMQRLP